MLGFRGILERNNYSVNVLAAYGNHWPALTFAEQVWLHGVVFGLIFDGGSEDPRQVLIRTTLA